VRRSAVAAQSDGLMTHYHDAICTDRVAIVTGGSRGVGRELVRKLASRGYAVVVGYIRDLGAADSIVEEVLADAGPRSPSAPTSPTISTSNGRSQRRPRRSGVSTSWSTRPASSSVTRLPTMTSTGSMSCCGPTCGARSSSTGRRRGSSVTEERSSTSPALPSAWRCRPTPLCGEQGGGGGDDTSARLRAPWTPHHGQCCRTRAGEPGRPCGHRRHRGIPRQRRRPQPQRPGHPCRRRDRVKTRAPWSICAFGRVPMHRVRRQLNNGSRPRPRSELRALPATTGFTKQTRACADFPTRSTRRPWRAPPRGVGAA
jgi:hypothetical protein